MYLDFAKKINLQVRHKDIHQENLYKLEFKTAYWVIKSYLDYFKVIILTLKFF